MSERAVDQVDDRKSAAVEHPWKFSASEYQAALGVPQPHIGEASGYQVNRMSNAERKRYNARRESEWAASRDCKAAWAAGVLAGYAAGLFTIADRDVSREAVAVGGRVAQRIVAAHQRADFAAAIVQNGYTDIAELAVGDRPWSIMASAYGTVQKVNRSTVQMRFDSGIVMNISAAGLQRMSPRDLSRHLSDQEGLDQCSSQPPSPSSVSSSSR